MEESIQEKRDKIIELKDEIEDLETEKRYADDTIDEKEHKIQDLEQEIKNFNKLQTKLTGQTHE